MVCVGRYMLLFHATFRCFIFSLYIFIYFLYIYDII